MLFSLLTAISTIYLYHSVYIAEERILALETDLKTFRKNTDESLLLIDTNTVNFNEYTARVQQELEDFEARQGTINDDIFEGYRILDKRTKRKSP